MRLFLLLLPSLLLAQAVPPPAPQPPYVLRVLALGHEPERKFFLRSDGFYDMHALNPEELPPQEIFARLPTAAPVTGSPEPERIRVGVMLNAVGEVQLPSTASVGETLILERAKVTAAKEGKPAETRYERLGEIPRTADSSSALVLLYNPSGRRTWEDVRPSIIDTSGSRVPPGSLLVMNLCAEPLEAVIAGRGGQLVSGQSALVNVATAAGAPLELRLSLLRGATPTQLVDSARTMPASRRALLIVYPVPIARNARSADFLLIPLSVDPVIPSVGKTAAR